MSIVGRVTIFRGVIVTLSLFPFPLPTGISTKLQPLVGCFPIPHSPRAVVPAIDLDCRHAVSELATLSYTPVGRPRQITRFHLLVA